MEKTNGRTRVGAASQHTSLGIALRAPKSGAVANLQKQLQPDNEPKTEKGTEKRSLQVLMVWLLSACRLV